MSKVAIISLGHYVPKRILTNRDLEKLVETSDEWIITRTGIKERRVAAKGERTCDMAIGAAQEALAKAQLSVLDVELIIVATATPDHNFPSVACLVQKGLGAKNAAAFDVSAACSGFLFALTTAEQYIKTGLYKNALVIAAEKMTRILDWNDRGTCVLFGDGAGACLLGLSQGKNGILSDYLHAKGEFADLMYVSTYRKKPCDQTNSLIPAPHIVMHGQELFKIAVNSMAEAIEVAAQKANIKISDIDCIVPHQANDRIISAIAKKLTIPKEKVFVNIHKYGNMSAASIAVALYEAVEEGRIKSGDIVALVSFGAGLVEAANIIRW
ncbi:MAG TPA: beta-ketoacyl-ACP synthase III [Candidatus Omnitrophota bacterium]|nr:beta-ketoacyl-ACP synthase III [Candidatus Omnitrophota bacterium]HPN88975.1 beta-ketoacyl-ACP synthase III [Candidatus Omnitrophota bacterium]